MSNAPQRRRSFETERISGRRPSFRSGPLSQEPSFRASLDGGLNAEGDLEDTIEEGQQEVDNTWKPTRMQRVMANLLGRIAPAKQQQLDLQPRPSPDSTLPHPFATSASALSVDSSTRESSAHSATTFNRRSGSGACSAAAMVLMQLRPHPLHQHPNLLDLPGSNSHPNHPFEATTDLPQEPPLLDQTSSLPGGLRSRLSRVSNSDDTFLSTCPLPSSSYPHSALSPTANASASTAPPPPASSVQHAGRLFRLAHSPLMELFTLRPHMVRNFNLRPRRGRPASPTASAAAAAAPFPPAPANLGSNPAADDPDGIDHLLLELEQEADGRAPVVPTSPRVSPPQQPDTPPTEPRAIAARSASFRSSDPQLPLPRTSLQPHTLLHFAKNLAHPPPPASTPAAAAGAVFAMPSSPPNICISDPLTFKLEPSTSIAGTSIIPLPSGKPFPAAPVALSSPSPLLPPRQAPSPPLNPHLPTVFRKAKSMDPYSERSMMDDGLLVIGRGRIRPPLRQSRSCSAVIAPPCAPAGDWPALLQRTSACT